MTVRFRHEAALIFRCTHANLNGCFREANLKGARSGVGRVREYE